MHNVENITMYMIHMLQTFFEIRIITKMLYTEYMKNSIKRRKMCVCVFEQYCLCKCV